METNTQAISDLQSIIDQAHEIDVASELGSLLRRMKRDPAAAFGAAVRMLRLAGLDRWAERFAEAKSHRHMETTRIKVELHDEEPDREPSGGGGPFSLDPSDAFDEMGRPV